MVKKKKDKIVDWTEIVPTCQRLQKAGYKLSDMRLAWRAAERGGFDHPQIEAGAYKAARASGIDEVTIITWTKIGTTRQSTARLVGLGRKVAYVDHDGQTLTFSLAHGRTAYGSQHRTRAKLEAGSLSKLVSAIQGLSELEEQLLARVTEPTTVRDLSDQLSLSKMAIYHALRRLRARRLVKVAFRNGSDHFQCTRQEDAHD